MFTDNTQLIDKNYSSQIIVTTFGCPDNCAKFYIQNIESVIQGRDIKELCMFYEHNFFVFNVILLYNLSDKSVYVFRGEINEVKDKNSQEYIWDEFKKTCDSDKKLIYFSANVINEPDKKHPGKMIDALVLFTKEI